MLPFKLIEDLSIESRDEFEAIIADMKNAIANDDDSSSDTKIELDTTTPPTLSR